MTEPARKTVVSVQIAGEEFVIRTEASDEYTRECAEFVDRTIRQILEGGAMLQAHKASVLAALAITDQLFKASREVETLRAEAGRRASLLSADISRRLERRGLATGS